MEISDEFLASERVLDCIAIVPPPCWQAPPAFQITRLNRQPMSPPTTVHRGIGYCALDTCGHFVTSPNAPFLRPRYLHVCDASDEKRSKPELKPNPLGGGAHPGCPRAPAIASNRFHGQSSVPVQVPKPPQLVTAAACSIRPRKTNVRALTVISDLRNGLLTRSLPPLRLI